MKKSFLLLLILVASWSYSQSVNDYKAVIIPLKYDFLKNENQYRLNTITKFNFIDAGFTALYTKDVLGEEYNDRCNLLYVDVINESGFFTTKLYIVLKDCNDKIIYRSDVGKSSVKEYEVAYPEALNQAFQSIYDLQYKYNTNAVKNALVVAQAPAALVGKEVMAIEAKGNSSSTDANLLYAQATPTGFQLIDSTPKVVMNLFKTSQPNSFIAIRDAVQGSLILNGNEWFFEYYQNGKLISEKIVVKF